MKYNIMEKLKHLNNEKGPILIVLGGIPGCGKSTFSEELHNLGYKIFSSDEIRFELAKKEECNKDKFEYEIDNLEDYTKAAFNILFERMETSLSNGEKVVFDATNTTIKSRKRVLSLKSKYKIKIIAVYLECSLETALNNNLKRHSTVIGIKSNGESIYGRYVPDYYIKFKWETQALPTRQEGFDEVHIFYDELNYRLGYLNDIIAIKESDNLNAYMHEHREIINEIFPEFKKCWDMDQRNPYHKLTLDNHIIECAKSFQKDTLELFLGALLHDIGKPITQKQFGKILVDTKMFKEGEKVEIKFLKENGFISAKISDYQQFKEELLTIKHVDVFDKFNYYGHEYIGARIARKYMIELGFTEKQADLVYRYVLYHMSITSDIVHTDKSLKKVINKIGKYIIEDIIRLKIADSSSCKNYKEGDLENQSQNINSIRKLLRGEIDEYI